METLRPNNQQPESQITNHETTLRRSAEKNGLPISDGVVNMTGDTDYFARRSSVNVTETIVNRATAAIFQRDEKRSSQPDQKRSSGTGQSLGAYDAYGVVSNPSESENLARLQQEATQLIEVRTPRMSSEEREYMGLLYPELVKAIVLDENHIDKIYDKDISSVQKIALDWFLHPDGIENTHIRVGYGGEEVVGSRSPAYIIPALTTLERVKDAFGSYANWALHHELCATDSESVNESVGKRIKEKIGPQTNDDGTEFTQNDYLAEIQKSNHLSISDAREILKDTWMEKNGEQPDMTSLGKKYHFTEKLPKIVVFNASNAAIEIDRMDRDKVIAARDQTQAHLRRYAEEFHPEVAQNLVFENDKPWEEHDYYTEMLTLYVSDIIDNENGKKKDIEEKLYQFGQHHQRDEDGPIKGMNRSDLYGKMHVFFFEDPQITDDWSEKLPAPNVMDRNQGIPRNVIYHQGNPEIKFGLYRKIASEKANLSGFIQWLRQRQSLADSDTNIAQNVTARAHEIQSQSSGKRDFRSCLGEAVNKAARGNNSAKSIFFEFMGSDVFGEAEDKEEAWAKFASRLERDIKAVDSEKTRELIAQLATRQQVMNDLNHEVSLVKKGETEKLDALYNTPEGMEASNERVKLEMVTTQGDLPVYYPLEGADSVVWPNGEIPSLERYESKLKESIEAQKRLEGTIKYTEDKVIMPETDQSEDGWTLFSESVDQFINTSLANSDVSLEQLQEEDVLSLKEVYSQADSMETKGNELNKITQFLQDRVRKIINDRSNMLASTASLDQSAAVNFVNQQLIPDVAKKAKEQTLRDAAAEVSKASSVLADYKSILADIDPDERVAEIRYNEMLNRICVHSNGKKPADSMEGRVVFAQHAQ